MGNRNETKNELLRENDLTAALNETVTEWNAFHLVGLRSAHTFGNVCEELGISPAFRSKCGTAKEGATQKYYRHFLLTDVERVKQHLLEQKLNEANALAGRNSDNYKASAEVQQELSAGTRGKEYKDVVALCDQVLQTLDALAALMDKRMNDLDARILVVMDSVAPGRTWLDESTNNAEKGGGE